MISIIAILAFIAIGEYLCPYGWLETWAEKMLNKHSEPVTPKELNDLAERMTREGRG